MSRQRILSKMKRIEMIVETRQLDAIIRLIEKHATGYTLIPGATGLGEHGYRERDVAVLVTIVTPDHLDAIVDAMLPSMGERTNVVCISDVTVLRAEHFIPEVRAAANRAKT